MNIRISVEGEAIIATLDDNATTRDFLSLLPLSIDVEDYAATEKIAYLPKPLSTDGAPAAITPVASDVAYYAPWGNLAIFYNDGHHSPGLVKLGTIDGDLAPLRRSQNFKATIERVTPSSPTK